MRKKPRYLLWAIAIMLLLNLLVMAAHNYHSLVSFVESSTTSEMKERDNASTSTSANGVWGRLLKWMEVNGSIINPLSALLGMVSVLLAIYAIAAARRQTKQLLELQ